MVRGWATSPDGRHHGAHYAEAAQALGTRPDGFMDFSANINPLGAPEAALAAGANALYGEAGRYPDLRYTELRAALAGYLGVSPDRVLPTNGGAEALFLAARTAAAESAGKKAVVLEPTFSEYAAAAHAASFEVERVVVRWPETTFRFDPAVLDAVLDGSRDVGLVFLCNPNNPTGDAVSRREVLSLAERVREAGAVLVVDEAFADFAPHLSVAREAGEGLYVARSFTKFFAVPGLRLGCLVTPETERVRTFQPSWPVNAVASAVGIAAAADESFAEVTLAEVAQRRRELFSALGGLPGLTPYPGAANFLLVRAPEGLAEELALRGVLVRGCEPFRGLGPSFFRVAVRGAGENERLVEEMRGMLGGTP
ncbi:MAG: L-threonine 3-O-phosphate decarboxylase [uncultured Rubrobacteraceae bacterium]|uniref:threonine-phosphate decarboxylase n=1 Tax=uncultured Rubrobacteraceae bacterium TaxID=349277 RepID=A0A6J4PUW1_9ACTN|nr:MAG: L-threonine 3-O-phosphate decarboxylase [uncultured Rubrobacteraceae bacterium]